MWCFEEKGKIAYENDSQARIQEIADNLQEVKNTLAEMDRRLNATLEPLLKREKEIELDLKQRAHARDILERQLLVTKGIILLLKYFNNNVVLLGKPLKVMNEIKRMTLEMESLVPELRPIKQRIVTTRLKVRNRLISMFLGDFFKIILQFHRLLAKIQHIGNCNKSKSKLKSN